MDHAWSSLSTRQRRDFAWPVRLDELTIDSPKSKLSSLACDKGWGVHEQIEVFVPCVSRNGMSWLLEASGTPERHHP
jgi:hypothetical protein